MYFSYDFLPSMLWPSGHPAGAFVFWKNTPLDFWEHVVAKDTPAGSFFPEPKHTPGCLGCLDLYFGCLDLYFEVPGLSEGAKWAGHPPWRAGVYQDVPRARSPKGRGVRD